jgi:hypothetical protein
MKGFGLLVAALAGAALLYVTTAVGGPQAGPTRAEFNALKKKVTALQKDDTAVKTILGACFIGAVPTARFSDYEARAADGTTFVTTGLDVADVGETPAVFLLDVGQDCAGVLNTASLKIHGLKLLRPQAAGH